MQDVDYLFFILWLDILIHLYFNLVKAKCNDQCQTTFAKSMPFFSYFCSRNCYEMSKKSLTFWIVSFIKDWHICIKKSVTSRKNCRFWLILNDIIDIEKKKARFIFLFYAFFAFMFLLFCFSFIFHLLLECAESWMSTWQKGIYFFFWPFFFP